MKLLSLALAASLVACSSSPTAPLDAADDGYRISVGSYEFSARVPQGNTSRRWNGTLTVTAVTNTRIEGEWDASGLEPGLSSAPDTEVGRGRFLVKGFGNIVNPFNGEVERYSLEMMLVPVRGSDVVDCTELVWRQATVVAQPGECSLTLTQGVTASTGAMRH